MPTETARDVDVALLEQLVGAGERLTEAETESIVDRGREVVPALIEILENEDLARKGAAGDGYAPIHAARILGELQAGEAVEPMLRVVARSDVMDIVYGTLINALQSIGPAVVGPALAAHAAAATDEQRSAVADVLSVLDVRDERILAVLLSLLERNPELGAGLLAKYGDPAALPQLGAALDRCEVDGRGGLFANQEIIELEATIDELGGSLTEEQERKVRAVEASRNAARAPLMALDGPGEHDEAGEEEEEPDDDDELERGEVLERFSTSPHAEGDPDLGWIDLALIYGAEHLGVSLAGFNARALREVLFELFPRKVSCEASEAPEIVRSLRAFFTFARDVLAHAHAEECLEVLGEDAIPKLARRLGDPSSFGMAKSFVMTGRSRGSPVDSEEGLHEGSETHDAEPAAPSDPTRPASRDRTESKRKKKLRKLRKQAQRRNRG